MVDQDKKESDETPKTGGEESANNESISGEETAANTDDEAAPKACEAESAEATEEPIDEDL